MHQQASRGGCNLFGQMDPCRLLVGNADSSRAGTLLKVKMLAGDAMVRSAVGLYPTLACTLKMRKCKALFCPTQGTPYAMFVGIPGLGLYDQPELQRVLGAPEYDLRRVTLWQDSAPGQPPHTSLEVFCRDWHGLEARSLTNQSAPHIQVLEFAAKLRCA